MSSVLSKALAHGVDRHQFAFQNLQKENSIKIQKSGQAENGVVFHARSENVQLIARVERHAGTRNIDQLGQVAQFMSPAGKEDRAAQLIRAAAPISESEKRHPDNIQFEECFSSGVTLSPYPACAFYLGRGFKGVGRLDAACAFGMGCR